LTSSGLDPVPRDAYGERSLNQLNGDHQARVAITILQDSLDSVEASAANPYALSDFEERVRIDLYSLLDDGLDCFDLVFGYCDPRPPHTHETSHPICPQDSDTCIHGIGNTHEDVARKYRRMNETASVTPLTRGRMKRKESFDPFGVELSGSLLFMSWASLHGKPRRFG
jgi:hypothetical protein